MPYNSNPTRTAATMIIRHGDNAENRAALELNAASSRGDQAAAALWREVKVAVRAIQAVEWSDGETNRR